MRMPGLHVSGLQVTSGPTVVAQVFESAQVPREEALRLARWLAAEEKCLQALLAAHGFLLAKGHEDTEVCRLLHGALAAAGLEGWK